MGKGLTGITLGYGGLVPLYYRVARVLEWLSRDIVL